MGTIQDIQKGQLARVEALAVERERDRTRKFLQTSQDLWDTVLLPRARVKSMLGQFRGEGWAEDMLKELGP